MPDSIEPIPPDVAREILERAIAERLGDDWRDADSGWRQVTGHDYMARLTRGRVNIDFYVDLLGNVTTVTSEISPVQDSGRLIVGMLLLVSLGIALMIARVLGWL